MIDMGKKIECAIPGEDPATLTEPWSHLKLFGNNDKAVDFKGEPLNSLALTPPGYKSHLLRDFPSID